MKVTDVSELLSLFEQREKCLNLPEGSINWKKLIGEEPAPGGKILIFWKDWHEDENDEGYLFDLPIGTATDEGDIFVHIPHPQNPSGIGAAPEVFTHLQFLITNALVTKLIVSAPN